MTSLWHFIFAQNSVIATMEYSTAQSNGFNADPDPAFKVIRIQIQGFHEQKFKKFTAEKNSFFLSKIPQRTSKPQEKLSALKTENSAHQNLNFFPFFFSFLGHFCSPGSRSGSTLPMRVRIQPKKSMRIRIRNTGPKDKVFFPSMTCLY